MEEPLGRAVGNSLEVIETIEFLKGNMPDDLRDLTYELAALALTELERFNNLDEAKKYIDELIYSKKALDKFKEIIIAQGASAEVIDDYSKLPKADIKYELRSDKKGYVDNIDALKIAKACKLLGAGREKKTDSIDYSIGIYLNKKSGEYVEVEEIYATILSNQQESVKEAETLVKEAFSLSEDMPLKRELIYKVLN
jgi:pyrimidine-nucleoside phosphorylase